MEKPGGSLIVFSGSRLWPAHGKAQKNKRDAENKAQWLEIHECGPCKRQLSIDKFWQAKFLG
jgi:hypothetical protein